MTVTAANHYRNSVAIDLEVGRESGTIRRLAAVRCGEQAQPLVLGGHYASGRLNELDAFAEGAEYVVGHNLIAFDLPHIRTVAPEWRN